MKNGFKPKCSSSSTAMDAVVIVKIQTEYKPKEDLLLTESQASGQALLLNLLLIIVKSERKNGKS